MNNAAYYARAWRQLAEDYDAAGEVARAADARRRAQQIEDFPDDSLPKGALVINNRPVEPTA